MSEGTQRRLAAIVSADVVGYSRLMGADEAGTLAALRQMRGELFQPTVQDHQGIIMKSMGDGWLVEFDSVTRAVSFAIKIQEKLTGHDIIKLRVGIHLGDIVHEDEDIYGDGINIAARLQELVPPGAVLISNDVQRQLDDRQAASFTGWGNGIPAPARSAFP